MYFSSSTLSSSSEEELEAAESEEDERVAEVVEISAASDFPQKFIEVVQVFEVVGGGKNGVTYGDEDW